MKDKRTTISIEEIWDLQVGSGFLAEKEEGLSNEDTTEVATKPTEEDQIPSEAPPASMGNMLADIRKFAAWGGEEGDRNLAKAKKLFLTFYRDEIDRMAHEIHLGKEAGKAQNKAYKHGTKGTNPKDFNAWLQTIKGCNRHEKKRIRKSYEKGRTSRKKFQERERKRKNNIPLSSVKARTKTPGTSTIGSTSVHRTISHNDQTALHANDIRSLKPSRTWTVVLDESGSDFEIGPDDQRSARVAGRVVAVVAAPEALKDLKPNWHAVDESEAEADRVMQDLLDSDAGVIGVETSLVPMTGGERWLDSIGLVLDWILRLIPIDENGARIRVLIEQRGSFNKAQPWELLQRQCLRSLALAFPERARRIQLEIESIQKTGHPWNGYADVIAYTWACATASSKERLKQSGLQHTCLLARTKHFKPEDMLNSWDQYSQGVHVAPEKWWNWLMEPDALKEESLLSALLHALSFELSGKRASWEEFLGYVKQKMASSPVDLRGLARAVDWLQNCQPKDTRMPPALRLAWLTVQLARTNHEGAVEQGWNTELAELEARLMDEAAPLVCHAQLHRAVAMTNAYRFKDARDLLDHWLENPVAVPGTRLYAQVLSSLGQHEAFLGNPKAAEDQYSSSHRFVL